MSLIDIHTHVVPEFFPTGPGRHSSSSWPSMVPAQPCHRHVMVAGSIFRTVSHQCWDCTVRIDDMDAMSVGRQVLSPMPELLSYWMEAADASVMCRYLNEVIATMVTQAPSRFFGLGAVPLQDIAAAIAELDFAIHRLGLAGVEIGGNVNGTVIGDARFAPFFEAAEEWGAAIFVHPLRPTGMDRLAGPGALEQVLAFPSETGLAAASLITGGVMERFPKLRIAFSHGGGTLITLLPRLQHAWQNIAQVRDAFTSDPTRTAQRMYFDDLVYDAPTIHRLIDVFGSSQILVGSDYPFVIMEGDPLARVDSLGLGKDTLAQLKFANAERWLGIGNL